MFNNVRCWKKQLTIAKDARRVDVLCYRIYLSYRLLDGTSRFKELHNIVQEAKAKLEMEVGPVDGVSSKMARGIVSRLPIASDVQKLCIQAIQKADEWLANVNPESRGWNYFFHFLNIQFRFSCTCFFYTVYMIWCASLTHRGFTPCCLQVCF